MADDEATARKIAFNDSKKYKCVTLKGDAYNPSGILSGGYNESSKILFRVQEFREFDERRAEFMEKERRLDSKLKQLSEDCKIINTC